MNPKCANLRPLPPELDLLNLIDRLLSAQEAVSRYDETVKRFINPDLVLPLLLNEEARASSTIEGTEISLMEILKQDVRQSPDLEEGNRQARDYREVVNYRMALTEGAKRLQEHQPLSSNLIQSLHEILLNSVRGQDKHPGKFRNSLVFIGKPGDTIDEARYIPPDHTQVPSLLDDLLSYMNGSKKHNSLIKTAVFHHRFEAIHPFADGNGRLGRMLIPLCLYKESLISRPNLYLSGFFEEHRRDYYEHLRRVDQEGDWYGWLDFFLAGVRFQAVKHMGRMDEVERFYKKQTMTFKKLNSKYDKSILDFMFQRPVFTVRAVLDSTEIGSHQTASNLIKKLMRMNILKEADSSGSKSRYYIYYELLNLL